MAGKAKSKVGLTATALCVSASLSGAISGFVTAIAGSSGGFGLEDALPGLVYTALMFPVGVAFGLIFVLPILAVVLLPVHVLLLRFSAATFFAYTIILAALGALICVAIFRFDLFPFGVPWPLPVFRQILIGLVAGSLGGGVFWWFRRPDRDAPPTQSNTAP